MRDSECYEDVVNDSEVHKADVVSEVRLVGEIDNALYENCKVYQADE